jgi:hypothetical protein
MKEKTPKPRTLVYLPADAKLNFENNTQDPPNTKYDNRKKIFDEESIKKVVGGLYGRNNRSNRSNRDR